LKLGSASLTAVILDTDIGTDIDDTWALAMLLGCPELDLRLVTTVSGDTTYRARLVAGILAIGGRDDVPIGVGVPSVLPEGVPAQPQGGFARQAVLDGYRGGIKPDGVAALAECVMSSSELTTIIAIGPMTNVAAALALEPRIAGRARLIAMLGSLEGNEIIGSEEKRAEYNVARDVRACRAALEADWQKTITPLDTCGTVVLRGERYRQVRQASAPLTKALMRNYEQWCDAWPSYASDIAGRLDRHFAAKEGNAATAHLLPFVERSSTILFDTVAVYLAYDESLLNVRRLPVALGEDGVMSVAEGAPELRVATAWRDRDRFEEQLVQRLTEGPAPE
jgi:inosine-uridine nucleoside N-ribohydrolase